MFQGYHVLLVGCSKFDKDLPISGVALLEDLPVVFLLHFGVRLSFTYRDGLTV